MNREEINEYDLGLPVPIASLEERRRGIPAAVWDRLHKAKAKLGELFASRLHELRLFGSYARNQFDDESDVDVLVLTDPITVEEHDRAFSALLEISGGGIYMSPLFLTVAELDRLRAREKILAQDIDREGITV
ncbi:MAG: nucleotidyltransferase domain-containing protein [Byssovorax sp.]